MVLLSKEGFQSIGGILLEEGDEMILHTLPTAALRYPVYTVPESLNSLEQNFKGCKALWGRWGAVGAKSGSKPYSVPMFGNLTHLEMSDF